MSKKTNALKESCNEPPELRLNPIPTLGTLLLIERPHGAQVNHAIKRVIGSMYLPQSVRFPRRALSE